MDLAFITDFNKISFSCNKILKFLRGAFIIYLSRELISL